MYNWVYCFKLKFKHLLAGIYEYFTLGRVESCVNESSVFLFSIRDEFETGLSYQHIQILQTDSPYNVHFLKELRREFDKRSKYFPWLIILLISITISLDCLENINVGNFWDSIKVMGIFNLKNEINKFT